jgi:hypothetical protein
VGTPPEARGEGSSGVASRGVPESKHRGVPLKPRFQVFRLGFSLGFLFKKIFQEVSSSKVGFHGATSGKFEGLVLKGVGRIVQGTGMREEL